MPRSTDVSRSTEAVSPRPRKAATASLRRCRWAQDDALLTHYHDHEWGRAIRSDAGHLERMALEVFQCGLSWRIVLVKRDALRAAFRGFEPHAVASLSKADVNRMMLDATIIRNRRKIEAMISNAERFIDFADAHGSYVRWFDALPAQRPADRRRLFDVFASEFHFMGPETTKCYLMGVGKIPVAHDRGCFRAQQR